MLPQVHTEAEKTRVAVIARDITIRGDIEASTNLLIEGKVIGNVRCATLIIAESGYVHGTIYVDRVKVSGTVEGAIEAKDVAIDGSAQVTGDINYQRLRVSTGGLIDGKISSRNVTG